MRKISFVIPCYRSEHTIENVVNEIVVETEKLKEYAYEIIMVNDNSPDGLQEVLEKLASNDTEHIRVVKFSRNFGQHAGMIAGLRMSTGNVAVMLDDDGQCPLDHLADLLMPIENGWDVSIARYGKKKQSLFKNACSNVHEFVANALIDKPRDIQMSNFMAVSRVAIDETIRYYGPYPHISGLLFRSSARIINVPMEERVRLSGSTTYNLRKLFRLWLNSFTAFSIKPLSFATVLGSIIALCGFGYGILLVVRKFMNLVIPTGWSSLMAALLVIGGMILFVLGLIGEYIGRIYMSINNTPQYVISKTINFSEISENE